MQMDKYQGIITLPAGQPVRATMDRLENALRSKGVTIFARIDQQAQARLAGSDMAPLELLLFGNPKGGTPLMVAEPLSGLDLPLKAMAWEDHQGKSWLSYNSFVYLQERYDLPKQLIDAVAMVEGIIRQAAS